MKNPFKFDIEVEGEFFCGRTKNINDVVDYIDNETNIIMFSKPPLCSKVTQDKTPKIATLKI